VRLVAECALPAGVHLVRTDHDLLRQCLDALVSNAVRFTPAGSVTLRTSLESPADEGVPSLVYDVIDTGPGVSPADAARIFLPFEKADVHAPGAGLGLTVAAHVARALGGEVSIVASSPNGSHFRLRLAHPTLASQRGHASRRVAHAALPRTFYVAPSASPALADAAAALRAAGLVDASSEDAALVLLAAPAAFRPAGTPESALADVASRQLALVIHGAEDATLAVRDVADAGTRIVHAAAPLYQARLWPALVQAADAFDALDLATFSAAPRLPSPPPPRPPLELRARCVLRVLLVDDNVREAAARACARADGHAEDEPRHPAHVQPPARACVRGRCRRRAGRCTLPRGHSRREAALTRPGLLCVHRRWSV
jgi:hypothetical protein